MPGYLYKSFCEKPFWSWRAVQIWLQFLGRRRLADLTKWCTPDRGVLAARRRRPRSASMVATGRLLPKNNFICASPLRDLFSRPHSRSPCWPRLYLFHPQVNGHLDLAKRQYSPFSGCVFYEVVTHRAVREGRRLGRARFQYPGTDYISRCRPRYRWLPPSSSRDSLVPGTCCT